MMKLAATFITLVILTTGTPVAMADQSSAGIRAFEKGEYQTALSLLTAEADNGSMKALYALGLMHEYGLGIDTSRSQAASYYFKGAQMNTRLRQPVMARVFATALERTGIQ